MRQSPTFKQLLPAALFFAFILYNFVQYVGISREDFGIGTDGPWIGGALFLLLIFIGIGAMAVIHFSGSSEGGEWQALKSAFPPSRSPGTARFASAGKLQLSDVEFVLVRMTVSPDGVRLIKRSQLTNEEDSAFIPWARIQKVAVQEPRRLKKCRSLEDRQKLAARLVAELTISRGDFPAFTVAVPWQEEFKAALPHDVELKQSWDWPTVSDFVYH